MGLELRIRRIDATHAKRVAPPRQAVLVVDASEDVRALASQALVAAGYGVITASNGIEGLAIYRRYRKSIGVVVIDKAAADVIRAIRIFAPHVRVLRSESLPEPLSPRFLVGAVNGILASRVGQ